MKVHAKSRVFDADILLESHQLILKNTDTSSAGGLDAVIRISYSSIQLVRVVAHSLWLETRHLTTYQLVFSPALPAEDPGSCALVAQRILTAMHVTTINDLFVFSPQAPQSSTQTAGFWPRYDPQLEYARMGVSKARECPWRLSQINASFQYSPTYPRLLAVPVKISDNVLKHLGAFRSKSRIPVLSYIHPHNKVFLV